MERKRLTDILHGDRRDRLADTWNSTKAAEDFAPLPPGEYVADVLTGELFTSKTNSTPGYKLTFQIAEGEYVGRRAWHDLWLTEPALPMTKRDLAKLGISSIEQLETPVPQGIRCRIRVALRREEDGTEHNRVRSFEVISITAPTQDAFAPDAEGEGDATFDPSKFDPESFARDEGQGGAT